MAALGIAGGSEGVGAQSGPASKRVRERRCIVSKTSGDAAALIRFARAPDGSVVPDIKETLPGRGCWIAADRKLVEKAVDRQLFSRAFKAQSRADAALPVLVEQLLRKDALGLLALARKAGHLILGEMQVVQAARYEPLAAVIHASDGAENGLNKVVSALHGSPGTAKPILVRHFSRDELSLALGLPNVIHAALPDGQIGTAFAQKARKLAAYCGDDGGSASNFTTDRGSGPAVFGQDTGSWDE